ncbi:MAG TPA: hypothetical protein VF062_04990 [Candidatus Limnocylindrales bacterium]
MSEHVELAEAEREELERSLRWHFAAHAEQPNPGYAGLGVQNAVNIVTRIVKAREAAARREALLEAAEHFTTRANAAHRDDLHVLSDAWDQAASDLRALAEPERDEEGS